jgi:4-diphosphocytidyl-2-C-methyl-D-erythritol kinase
MLRAKAFAKINLCLYVLHKRADGFHELRSLMQSVSLCDILTFEPAVSGITLQCSAPDIPCNEKNTVYKAAQLLRERYKVRNGVTVTIEKHIPFGAGLAGGSADAAAALQALNVLWDLKASPQELLEIGAEVGSDVPFCFLGGTVLAEGRGEQLTKIYRIKGLTGLKILLITPPISISTAWVYQQIPKTYKREAPNIEYGDGGSEAIRQLLHNDLEEFTFSKYPEVNNIKEEMVRQGAQGSLMSGSGSSVFGLYNDDSSLKKAYEHFKHKFINTFIVEAVPQGVEII